MSSKGYVIAFADSDALTTVYKHSALDPLLLKQLPEIKGSQTAPGFSTSSMDVPVFGQRQDPWQSDKLGSGPTTIGQEGCALTSVAMILKYYKIATDPRDLNNWLKNNSGYSGSDGNLIRWDVAAGRSGGTVSFTGRNDWSSVPADLGVINSELDSGYPVIAEVRLSGYQHFVVITGHDGGTYSINDPWYADKSTINSRYGNPTAAIYGICKYHGSNPNIGANNLRWTGGPDGGKWYRQNLRLSYAVDGTDPLYCRERAGDHDATYQTHSGYFDMAYGGEGWKAYRVDAWNAWGSQAIDHPMGWDDQPPSVAWRDDCPARQSWLRGNPNATFIWSDAGAGVRGDVNITYCRWNGGTKLAQYDGVASIPEGKNTLEVRCEDDSWWDDGNHSGNATAISGEFWLDNTAPSISVTSPSSTSTWINTTQSLGWDINDPNGSNGSGIASGFPTLQWDGGAENQIAASGSMQIPEGKHSITIHANDVAGNTSTKSAGEWWIDTLAPNAQAVIEPNAPNGENGWYTTTPSVSVGGADQNGAIGSGLKSLGIITDGKPEAAYTNPVPLTGDGTHTYTGIARDYAGNEGRIDGTCKVDTSPAASPIVNVDSESGSLNILTASWNSDDPDSGITQYDYAIGTNPGGHDILSRRSAGIEKWVYNTGLHLVAGHVYYYTVWAKNGAGLWSPPGISGAITVVEASEIIGALVDSGGVSADARKSTNYMLVDSMGQFVVSSSSNDKSTVQHGYWNGNLTSIQPDLWARLSTAANYTGNDIYEKSPVTQVFNQSGSLNNTIRYYVVVQNDSKKNGTVNVKGNTGANGWQVIYRDAADKDITSAVSAGNWQTPELASGATYRISVLMTPTSNITSGSMKVTVNASSMAEPILTDAISITASSQWAKPDILGRPTPASVYIGSNIYEAVPVTQICSQAATFCQTVSYRIHIENDGNASGIFSLKGTAGANGWLVVYKDGNGSDVTSSVISGAYRTSALAAGGSCNLTVYVTPQKSITSANMNLQVTASTITSPVISDSFAFNTSSTWAKPDMYARPSTTELYTGIGIYEMTPVIQKCSMTTDIGKSAVYTVRVKNNGNTPARFYISGSSSASSSPSGIDGIKSGPLSDTGTIYGKLNQVTADKYTASNVIAQSSTPKSGWQIAYKDANKADISSAIIAGTYQTPELAPGAVTLVSVYVTPGVNITSGTMNIQLTASTVTTPTVVDTMALNTDCQYNRPDVYGKASLDLGYTGIDIYEVNPVIQTCGQSLNIGETTTYEAVIENDGNTTKPFMLKGTAGANGWIVRYRDIDNTDITDAVTSGSYLTDDLAAGEDNQIFIDVTAQPGITSGKMNIILTAANDLTPAVVDSMAFNTSCSWVKPDIMGRATSASTYIGMNVYESTPITQVCSQTTDIAKSVSYRIRVENHGSAAGSFLIYGAGSANGWYVIYKDAAGIDVTSSVVAGTFRIPDLAPTTGYSLTVYVTPMKNVTTANMNIQVTASSESDAVLSDSIAYNTSCTMNQPSPGAGQGMNGSYEGEDINESVPED